MVSFEKLLSKIALPVIAIAAILIVLSIAFTTQSTNKDNNGYIRVINCVISIPSSIRTRGDIENCYRIVEKDLGIKLQRYDTSSYKPN